MPKKNEAIGSKELTLYTSMQEATDVVSSAVSEFEKTVSSLPKKEQTRKRQNKPRIYEITVGHSDGVGEAGQQESLFDMLKEKPVYTVTADQQRTARMVLKALGVNLNAISSTTAKQLLAEQAAAEKDEELARLKREVAKLKRQVKKGA